MWPANHPPSSAARALTRAYRASQGRAFRLSCWSGSYKNEIESVKEARQKDEHRSELTGLTKSPKALAKAPEVMKVEKRSDRDVGNRKPETSFAANIETRGSPTE